jgi:hypothetical protein
MSHLTGFLSIDDAPPPGVPWEPVARTAWRVQWAWRHAPAGSKLVYTWRDPRAFFVVASATPHDPHRLRSVFDGHLADTLPYMGVEQAQAAWGVAVAELSVLAYGDPHHLRARVRP